MITREQHDKFISRVREMKNKGFNLWINGQKIVKIDTDAIYTSLYTKDAFGKYERVRYSYNESVKPYLTLKELYSKVVISDIRLSQIYWGDVAEPLMLDLDEFKFLDDDSD